MSPLELVPCRHFPSAQNEQALADPDGARAALMFMAVDPAEQTSRILQKSRFVDDSVAAFGS